MPPLPSPVATNSEGEEEEQEEREIEDIKSTKRPLSTQDIKKPTKHQRLEGAENNLLQF